MSTQIVPEPPSSDVVHAGSPGCRMWAREYTPYGTYLSDFQDAAKPYGRLYFVYGNQLYDRPPKVVPLLRFYVARELARAGLRPKRKPVVAVAVTARCNLRRIDWRQIAEVPW
ncbi:MAG: hypothetical protein ABIQ32_13865 [Sphingomicrobium sp.]